MSCPLAIRSTDSQAVLKSATNSPAGDPSTYAFGPITPALGACQVAMFAIRDVKAMFAMFAMFAIAMFATAMFAM